MIAIPDAFVNPTIFDASTLSTFNAHCDVISANVTSSICLDLTYSLSVAFFDQVSLCQCNSQFLTNSCCSSVTRSGGQCLCRAGVTGRTCSRCAAGFYNLTTSGCTSCQCADPDGHCDEVSGQCVCPPNTMGMRCNQCVPNAYGFDAKLGCRLCECNAIGSASLQCNATGLCWCAAHVVGDKCDECEDAYANMTAGCEDAYANMTAGCEDAYANMTARRGCIECGCNSNGSVDAVCNKTTSACSCKTNVVGLRCDQCRDGYFDLSGENVDGCRQCECSGVTTECVSGDVERAQVTSVFLFGGSPSLGWTISREDGTNASDADLSIGIVSSSKFKLMAIKDVLDSSFNDDVGLFYWNAPSEYLGVKTSSYAGLLRYSIDYSTLPNSSFAVAPDVIIIGNNGKTAYHTLTNPPLPNQLNALQVSLNETLFTDENGAMLSSGAFQAILADIRFLLIRAEYETEASMFGICDVSLDVFQVGEKCSCPPAYTGSSCELCAFGYYRNGAGICTACQCNNHAADCDKTTGVCIACANNTEGDECERCRDGFYGDATGGTASDCTPCPCSSPSSRQTNCSVDVSGNPVCSCSAGYQGRLCDDCEPNYFGNPALFGGSCTQCDCNGNIDRTDPDSCNRTTGECLKCLGNTTGFECESCADGFYGDATTSDGCRLCSCDEDGSFSSICDDRNGSCPCRDNVVGQNCDRCAADYWNLASGNGCETCACNPGGSVNSSCDSATGKCNCAANVSGRRCDACESGYYDFDAGCLDCNCSASGAVNSTCDMTTGMCHCRAGSTGRRCDSCSPFFFSSSSEICVACDECTQTLLDVLSAENEAAFAALEISVESLEDYGKIDDNLTALNASREAEQNRVNTWLAELATIQTSLNTINTINVGIEARTIEARVTELTARAGELNNVARAQKPGIDDLRDKSSDLARLVVTISNDASIVQKNASALLSEARRLENSSAVLLARISTRDYASNLVEVSRIESDAEQALLTATSLRDQSNDLHDRLVAFEASLDQFPPNETLATSTVNQALAISSATQDLADEAARLLASTQALDSEIRSAKMSVESSLERIRITNEMTEENVNAAEANYAIASNLLYDTASGSGSGSAMAMNDGIVTQSEKLTEQLNSVNATLEGTELIVIAAEVHAQTLETNANEAQAVFDSVKGRGEAAVEAVQNYRDVSNAINESLALTAEANATVQATLKELERVADMNLNVMALSSKEESENVLVRAENASQSAAALPTSLATGKQLLAEAENAVVSAQEANLNVSTAIGSLPDFESALRSSNLDALVQCASDYEKNCSDVTPSSSQLIEEKRAIISQAQTNLTSANKTLNDVIDIADDVSEEISRRKSELTNVTSVANETRDLQTIVNNTLSRVRNELARARAIIGRVRSARHFVVNASLGFNLTNVLGSNATELSLQFQPDTTDGLLLYLGDRKGSSNSQYLALELISCYVWFKYNLGGTSAMIKHNTAITVGNWYEVVAIREFSAGSVTVVGFGSSGAVASDHSSGDSGNLALNDPLVAMGGSAQVPLELSPDLINADYVGCLDNVSVDGLLLDATAPHYSSPLVTVCNDNRSIPIVDKPTSSSSLPPVSSTPDFVVSTPSLPFSSDFAVPPTSSILLTSLISSTAPVVASSSPPLSMSSVFLRSSSSLSSQISLSSSSPHVIFSSSSDVFSSSSAPLSLSSSLPIVVSSSAAIFSTQTVASSIQTVTSSATVSSSQAAVSSSQAVSSSTAAVVSSSRIVSSSSQAASSSETVSSSTAAAVSSSQIVSSSAAADVSSSQAAFVSSSEAVSSSTAASSQAADVSSSQAALSSVRTPPLRITTSSLFATPLPTMRLPLTSLFATPIFTATPTPTRSPSALVGARTTTILQADSTSSAAVVETTVQTISAASPSVSSQLKSTSALSSTVTEKSSVPTPSSDVSPVAPSPVVSSSTTVEASSAQSSVPTPSSSFSPVAPSPVVSSSLSTAAVETSSAQSSVPTPSSSVSPVAPSPVVSSSLSTTTVETSSAQSSVPTPSSSVSPVAPSPVSSSLSTATAEASSAQSSVPTPSSSDSATPAEQTSAMPISSSLGSSLVSSKSVISVSSTITSSPVASVETSSTKATESTTQLVLENSQQAPRTSSLFSSSSTPKLESSSSSSLLPRTSLISFTSEAAATAFSSMSSSVTSSDSSQLDSSPVFRTTSSVGLSSVVVSATTDRQPSSSAEFSSESSTIALSSSRDRSIGSSSSEIRATTSPVLSTFVPDTSSVASSQLPSSSSLSSSSSAAASVVSTKSVTSTSTLQLISTPMLSPMFTTVMRTPTVMTISPTPSSAVVTTTLLQSSSSSPSVSSTQESSSSAAFVSSSVGDTLGRTSTQTTERFSTASSSIVSPPFTSTTTSAALLTTLSHDVPFSSSVAVSAPFSTRSASESSSVAVSAPSSTRSASESSSVTVSAPFSTRSASESSSVAVSAPFSTRSASESSSVAVSAPSSTRSASESSSVAVSAPFSTRSASESSSVAVSAPFSTRSASESSSVVVSAPFSTRSATESSSVAVSAPFSTRSASESSSVAVSAPFSTRSASESSSSPFSSRSASTSSSVVISATEFTLDSVARSLGATGSTASISQTFSTEFSTSSSFATSVLKVSPTPSEISVSPSSFFPSPPSPSAFTSMESTPIGSVSTSSASRFSSATSESETSVLTIVPTAVTSAISSSKPTTPSSTATISSSSETTSQPSTVVSSTFVSSSREETSSTRTSSETQLQSSTPRFVQPSSTLRVASFATSFLTPSLTPMATPVPTLAVSSSAQLVATTTLTSLVSTAESSVFQHSPSSTSATATLISASPTPSPMPPTTDRTPVPPTTDQTPTPSTSGQTPVPPTTDQTPTPFVPGPFNCSAPIRDFEFLDDGTKLVTTSSYVKLKFYVRDFNRR